MATNDQYPTSKRQTQMLYYSSTKHRIANLISKPKRKDDVDNSTIQLSYYTIDLVLTLVMYYAPYDKFLRSENELPDLIQYLYVK